MKIEYKRGRGETNSCLENHDGKHAYECPTARRASPPWAAQEMMCCTKPTTAKGPAQLLVGQSIKGL